MHRNPRANEEEQELAQTDPMDEEKERPDCHGPAGAADEDESED